MVVRPSVLALDTADGEWRERAATVGKINGLDTHSFIGDLPTLETERLRLRRLVLNDAMDVFEYASDPRVTQYVTWDVHRSVSDTEEFLRSTIARYARGESTAWGIEHKADGKVIGTCGFTTCLPHRASAELAYALSRRYWGQGLMTEAVRATIAFGFGAIRLDLIYAVCEIKNAASARVMEKAGMRFKRARWNYVIAKWRLRHLKEYVIERAEWERPIRTG